MTANLASSRAGKSFAVGLCVLGLACTSSPEPSPGPHSSLPTGGAVGSASGSSTGGSAGGSTTVAGTGGASGSATGGAETVAGGGSGGATLAGSAGTGGQPPVMQGPYQVLAFTKTTGFRHDSIPAGVELLEQLGATHDFTVVNTEDGADFTDENLAKYAVVVFMNASGELLDEAQQGAFERYIQAGGGYVGVHCASCAEDDWPWYGELVGARFTNHPAIQEVTINVENRSHPSTAELPEVWVRDEEPYNFDMSPRAKVTVLATLDEASYQGGTMGDDHPIVWAHEFQGGRSWYTGLGHLSQGYMEEHFVKLLLGGVEWAARRR